MESGGALNSSNGSDNDCGGHLHHHHHRHHDDNNNGNFTKQFMVEYNIACQSVSWSVVHLVENDFGTTGWVCRDH